MRVRITLSEFNYISTIYSDIISENMFNDMCAIAPTILRLPLNLL